jgi:secernin
MGCDTLVALAPATRDGVTLFAKNSDRPPRECQRLVQVPRATHPAGATLRCQYVELPQVAATAAFLGSQPWWLWGVEHGVNEHRVAIGNETVFAREPLGRTGLLGMDLVRLGLERGRTADEALQVMTELLATHGQGGSGQAHLEFPYHNAFLVADPGTAWILETSGRHWAARRVADVGNVSNGLALGADWERGSDDLTAFAVAQGWWPPDRGRVDFAAAYANDTGVPPNLCLERRRRAAALLAESRGQATPAVLRRVLRDHYDAGDVHRPRPFDDPRFFSLCMHADPLDNTTAAMVTTLPRDPSAIVTTWVCPGSPCVGAFLPCYPGVPVPAALASGGAEPDATSAWWRMRELLSLVERDFGRFGPRVRRRWDAFEADVDAERAAVEADAATAGDPARMLGPFVARTVEMYMETAGALVREIAAEA